MDCTSYEMSDEYLRGLKWTPALLHIDPKREEIQRHLKECKSCHKRWGELAPENGHDMMVRS